MHTQRGSLSLKHAYECVKRQRKQVFPNIGFWRQLETLERVYMQGVSTLDACVDMVSLREEMDRRAANAVKNKMKKSVRDDEGESDSESESDGSDDKDDADSEDKSGEEAGVEYRTLRIVDGKAAVSGAVKKIDLLHTNTNVNAALHKNNRTFPGALHDAKDDGDDD